MPTPKIAVIHDWLVTYAGAERVLEQILHCYPDADIFSLVDVLSPDERGFIRGKTVRTSVLQHFPFIKKKYRSYLLLMPLAIEQFDLSGYDIVISSSHAVAKGVLTGPDQLHICYCHSPIRYAWDLQHQYLRESSFGWVKSWLARFMLHKIRGWDVRTALGVDAFIANSHFIKRRIEKTYRRDSVVIHPPVSIDSFDCRADKEDFYLTASRMVPYKKITLIVEAFRAMPDKRLVVVGDGPDFAKIKAIAGPNVQLLGYRPFSELRDLMQRARAFVFAAEEDFGIIPVEAQACGTPVIAFGKGGVLDSLRGLDHDKPTGVFFNQQTPEALIAAVKLFEREGARITPENCRANAQRFSVQVFRDHLTAFVTQAYARQKTRLQEGHE